MRKYILNTNQEHSYEDAIPDIVDFNRDMLNDGFENIKQFEVLSKGKQVSVDLDNATINIDGKNIDLEVDSETLIKLKNAPLKWINFRRIRESFRVTGLISKTTKYGIGFQGLIDGQNIKRFVLVDTDEHELMK